MTWQIDPTHTQIEFSAKHMMITTVRGRFTDFEAEVNLDENNLTASTVEWTLQTASLNTHNEQRDAHLRSADFFDAEKYPTMTFRSTKITAAGAGRYNVTGDLTIRDVTRPITFNVTEEGQGRSPWGDERRAYSVTGSLNRKDWGLNWNVALEAGGLLVSEEVKINLDVQIKQVAAELVGAAA